jgi:hypothetical protein
LPPPTAERPPHRPENEACCVWTNATMKEQPVCSLPFKTTRFIEAVKKTRRFKTLVRASPNSLDRVTSKERVIFKREGTSIPIDTETHIMINVPCKIKQRHRLQGRSNHTAWVCKAQKPASTEGPMS